MTPTSCPPAPPIPPPPASAPVARLTYNLEEAATAIGCSVPSVRKLLRQRRLARLEGFRHVVIPIAAVEKFIKESTAFQS